MNASMTAFVPCFLLMDVVDGGRFLLYIFFWFFFFCFFVSLSWNVSKKQSFISSFPISSSHLVETYEEEEEEEEEEKKKKRRGRRR